MILSLQEVRANLARVRAKVRATNRVGATLHGFAPSARAISRVRAILSRVRAIKSCHKDLPVDHVAKEVAKGLPNWLGDVAKLPFKAPFGKERLATLVGNWQPRLSALNTPGL